MAGTQIGPAANQIGLPYDHWVIIAAISMLGGAVGGFAAYVGSVSLRPESPRRPFSVFDAFCRVVLGIAAGIGGNFVVLLSPIVSSFKDTAFALFTLSVSTLFGLFAERLIPAIQRSMEQRLGLAEKSISSVAGRVETVEQSVESVRSDVDTVLSLEDTYRTLVGADRPSAVPSRVQRAIDAAEAYLRTDPTNRRIKKELAKIRFERERNKEAAIAVLSSLIGDIESIPVENRTARDVTDLSDAYYDRACYYLVPPGPPDEGADKTPPTPEQISAALKDLARSAELAPEATREDAVVDDDFRAIRDTDGFRAIFPDKERAA